MARVRSRATVSRSGRTVTATVPAFGRPLPGRGPPRGLVGVLVLFSFVFIV